MDSSDKVTVFRDHLLESPLFRRLGFVAARIEYAPATELLSEGYAIRLENHADRVVTFKLLELAAQELVSVKVSNRLLADSFYLEDWLKQRGCFESLRVFWLSEYSGTFSERSLAFLAYLARVIDQTNLSPVLDGSEWEPIAFDWGGMR